LCFINFHHPYLFHSFFLHFSWFSANVPAVLAVTALICGAFGTFNCGTLEFPQTGSGDASISVGAWSYRTNNYALVGNDIWVIETCRSYRYLDKDLDFPYEIDSKTRAVMAFSILAAIFGILGCMLSFSAACGGNANESTFKSMGGMFLLVGLFQSLTLMIQSSSICSDNPVMQYLDSGIVDANIFSNECEWGSGYKAIISSVVFWFVAAFASLGLKGDAA